MQEIPEALPTTPSQEQPAMPQTKHRKIALVLLILIPVFLFVLIAGSLVYFFFFQTATVTITPDSRSLSTASTIAIVTETPDTTQNQIPGRVLPALTMSQEQTVPTTGIVHQLAQAASGTITFYNAAPYPQTVAADTRLTGADGVQVVTNEAASMPAAQYPTFGQATVTARTTQTGPAGNIKAGDIYGLCCVANVSAVNSAFSGGQDKEDYSTVAQQDIDTVATSLKTSLTQSVTAALQTQVQSGETLVTPPSCQPTVSTDHGLGEKATQVQVTESLSCTGITYNAAFFQQLLQQLQTQAARNAHLAHYHLMGEVHAAIQTVTKGTAGGATLIVQTTGVWVYQFSQNQLDHLAAQIAGKDTTQATRLLLGTAGVQEVSVRVSSGLGSLPADPQQIHFLLVLPQ